MTVDKAHQPVVTLAESPTIRYQGVEYACPIVITFQPNANQPNINDVTPVFGVALPIGYAMDLRDTLTEIIEAHQIIQRHMVDDEANGDTTE